MPKESVAVTAIKKQIAEQDELIKSFERELSLNKVVKMRLDRILEETIASKGKKNKKAVVSKSNNVLFSDPSETSSTLRAKTTEAK